MTSHPIYTMSFTKIYPLYIKKAERKGRTKTEVDTIICWLTGYSEATLQAQLTKDVDVTSFFEEAPQLNKHRTKITGRVCGVDVESITEPIMREIRYLDKLIDELAKGKTLETILRK